MTLFKNSFRTLGILASTALVIAMGTTAVHAKDDDGKPGKRIDRMVAHMEKELALTKEQSTKIRAILAKDSGSMPHHGEWKKGRHHEGHEGMGGGKHEGHGMGFMGGGSEFNKQLRSANVDTGALNRAFAARLDSMQTRMKEHHAKRVATFAEIHAVLTPEQRAKAADNMEKRHAEWEKKKDKKSKK